MIQICNKHRDFQSSLWKSHQTNNVSKNVGGVIECLEKGNSDNDREQVRLLYMEFFFFPETKATKCFSSYFFSQCKIFGLISCGAMW